MAHYNYVLIAYLKIYFILMNIKSVTSNLELIANGWNKPSSMRLLVEFANLCYNFSWNNFFPHTMTFMLTRCRCIFSECGLQRINTPFRLLKRWLVWKNVFMHPVCRFKVKLSGTENSQRNVIFYKGHYLNERLLQ